MTRAAAHHHSKPAEAAKVQRGAFAGVFHEYAARLARIAEQADAQEGEVREVWEERSSIRQYENKMLRDEAEAAALDDTESLFLARVKP